MPDHTSPAAVCQLRMLVHQVSPLIWRRLLVPGETTIARLHTIVQAAFGWSGEHLHRFTVHGTDYGISYDGGPAFRDDARQVRLVDLGLREGERFAYEYNFTAGWRVELRVEAIAASEPGRTYPRCVGGRRAGPPEDWDGPWDYLQRTQPHLVIDAAVRAAEILRELLDADPDEDAAAFLAGHHDELGGLLPLLGVDCFERRTLNKILANLTPTERTPTA